MLKVGRNDPCPCGSGLKFKKCHMGREEEIVLEKLEYLPEGAAEKIVLLPQVAYGRGAEFLSGLNLKSLTGMDVGIRLSI